MKPMLARTYGPKYNHLPCFVQCKLNGIRALFQNGTFQSRDEKLWRPGILDHIAAQLTWCTELVLDGELYFHGWRLQRINGAIAVNRTAPIDDTYQVQYHVFDVVDPRKKFSARFLPIYNALQRTRLPHVIPVQTDLIYLKEEIDLHFEAAVKAGYEGLMLRPDVEYEIDKRSKALWKRKQWEDGEFCCVGVTQGEGKASIGIGALQLKYEAPLHSNNDNGFFNVGTGFTDSERIAFAENPPIGKLVKVRYPYLSDDGIPQCPSFLAVLE